MRVLHLLEAGTGRKIRFIDIHAGTSIGCSLAQALFFGVGCYLCREQQSSSIKLPKFEAIQVAGSVRSYQKTYLKLYIYFCNHNK